MDLKITSLSERDWLKAEFRAIQIMSSGQFVIILTPEEEVFVLTLSAIENPSSNILMSDNYKLIMKKV